MTDQTSVRDEELGAALLQLDVPDHRPGFERRLHRLLAEERLAGGKRQRGTAGKSARHPWRLRTAVGVAAAALAGAAVALPLTGVVERVAGPEVAGAADVKARVRASLGALENLSGTLVSRCTERGCPGKAGERRWGFVLGASGDFRLEGPGEGEIVTYDASAGIVRSASRSASIGGDTVFYAERRGVAPGLPDPGPPTWLSMDEFGAFVRALLQAKDPRVQEVVYDGRPAWQLEVDTVPNAIVPDFTGDLFQITVDRETGVPVRVAELRREELLRETRLENLVVDARLAHDTFRLELPSGVEVSLSDDGFRKVSPAEGAGVVGYAVLMPAWTPEGYELAQVAVAQEGGPTGTEAGNPPSRNVVSLSYRRGLDQLVVTTRLALTGESWADPLATGEGYVDSPVRVRLRSGALAGADAEVVIAPRGLPHLWTVADGLVVTVAGELGHGELVRVAEALERR